MPDPIKVLTSPKFADMNHDEPGAYDPVTGFPVQVEAKFAACGQLSGQTVEGFFECDVNFYDNNAKIINSATGTINVKIDDSNIQAIIERWKTRWMPLAAYTDDDDYQLKSYLLDSQPAKDLGVV